VDVNKYELYLFERDEIMTTCEIFINGEKVEQVKDFVYLDQCLREMESVTVI
jgi:hypothetical protein